MKVIVEIDKKNLPDAVTNLLKPYAARALTIGARLFDDEDRFRALIHDLPAGAAEDPAGDPPQASAAHHD